MISSRLAGAQRVSFVLFSAINAAACFSSAFARLPRISLFLGRKYADIHNRSAPGCRKEAQSDRRPSFPQIFWHRNVRRPLQARPG